MKHFYRSRMLLKGLEFISAIRCISGLSKFKNGKGIKDFSISYKKFGENLKAEIRGKHFQSDLQSVLELAAGDCYHLNFLNWIPDVIIDGGGNTGLFSLAACSKWPLAEVRCYEPVPSNVEIIRKNFTINNLSKKVQLFSTAVGKETKNATFFIREANQGSLDDTLDFGETINVKVLRLWDIYEKIKSDRVLIKLDIEGAEFDVLEDFFEHSLLQNIVFIMEIHGNKEKQDQLLNRAKKANLIGKFWERSRETAHLFLASTDVGFVMNTKDDLI